MSKNKCHHSRLLYTQCRLNAWVRLAVACRGAHANHFMLCIACFLMFKHWCCWKYQYNKHTCLILSTIYIFIPVSVCVGRGPVHFFSRGPTMLLRWPCLYCYCFLSYAPALHEPGTRRALYTGSMCNDEVYLYISLYYYRKCYDCSINKINTWPRCVLYRKKSYNN